MDHQVNDRTLQAAVLGDRSALALLLEQLQDPWYRMSLTLLRDRDLARDATQETALRFLRQLPGFRGDSQIKTWSLGICLNVAREIRRAARERPMAPGAEPELAPADSGPLPEGAVEREEQTQLLHKILQSLPERQREAILLRFFEDLSIEQTAQTMRCAPGTVKATLHQALRTLRRKMAPEMVD